MVSTVSLYYNTTLQGDPKSGTVLVFDFPNLLDA